MTESAVEQQTPPAKSRQQQADLEQNPTAEPSSERQTYRTVRDLIGAMKEFRRRLAQAFEAAEWADDERVRQFVGDLKRRDRERQELLDELAEEDRSALETWRQNLPMEPLEDALRTSDELVQSVRDSADAVDLDEVIASCLEVEARAAEIYRSVAESVAAPSARDYLNNLADMSEATAADRAWAYHQSRQV